MVDALLNLGRTTADEIAGALAVSHQRGVVAARSLLEATDRGSESRPETALRLAIVDGGLPRPVTQWLVTDESGGFLARCDLGYPELRLGIEYLGRVHERQLAKDWGRQNLLTNAGVVVLGFAAEQLRNRPGVVRRVAEARQMQQERLGRGR
jgi:hypothetical protein